VDSDDLRVEHEHRHHHGQKQAGYKLANIRPLWLHDESTHPGKSPNMLYDQGKLMMARHMYSEKSRAAVYGQN
jgi:hypothetical protein